MATLAARLQALITDLGADYKVVNGRLGTLGSLTTTDKSSLVNAINEVNAKPTSSGGPTIDDDNPSLSKVYSSSKVNDLNSTLTGSLNNKVGISGDQTIDGVKTFTSSPVVPNGAFAVSKVTGLQAALDAKTAVNDTAPSTATTSAQGVWSPAKITAAIAQMKSDLVNGAGAAYDTLGEIAQYISDDTAAGTALTTAVGLRVRVDAAQAFNSTQKTQARANIDAYGSVELGNPDTDLVAQYALAKQ